MRIHANILAYRVQNDLLHADPLPTRIKFADWGEATGVGGKRIRVTEHSVVAVPRTQAKQGWDRVALDYEHNTVEGTPEYERTQEPRPVAAYGRVAIVAGDGAYLEDLAWTPFGEKFGREFCDLSPACAQTEDGTIVGVHSVALCRHGVIDGLHAFAVEIPEQGADKMNWKKWLAEFLGMPEETPDEDLKKGLTERIKTMCVEAAGVITAKVEALSAEVTALAGVKASEQLTALSAEVATLKTQIATFAAEGEKRDRQDLLAQAAREGKVVALSVEALGKLSLDDLKQHVTNLPVTVPVERRTPLAVQPLSIEAAGAGRLSELDQAVARRCGFSDAEVRKANNLK